MLLVGRERDTLYSCAATGQRGRHAMYVLVELRLAVSLSLCLLVVLCGVHVQVEGGWGKDDRELCVFWMTVGTQKRACDAPTTRLVICWPESDWY